MDAVVLYYDTITNYRKFKCSATGGPEDCLQRQFEGEEFFNDFILTHDGPPLFGDQTRRIRLDAQGDSTQRFAIYQLQTMTYRVRTLIRKTIQSM